MTRQEILNTPEIVDFMVDKSVIVDSKMKLHKRLEELCKLAIKALEQQSCEDCISREAVLEQARDYGSNTYLIPVNSVKTLPSVQPTRPAARWERVMDYNKCSNCGKLTKFYLKYNYCPNCGARMIESEDKK